MAIKAQGLLLRMETAARAAAKTITAVTAASPPVVSAASHGYAAGDIIYIDGIVGMTQLNGRAFVVSNPLTGTFELKGIDGTGYTTYASGGNAYKATLSSVAEVSNFDGFDGQASEIDVTNLQSLAKEYLIGLQDFGTANFDLFLRNADAGQVALRAAKESAAAKIFAVTLSDATVAAFVGFVKSFSASGSADGAVAGKTSIRITGAPAWFA